jgi:hypothetical protein
MEVVVKEIEKAVSAERQRLIKIVESCRNTDPIEYPRSNWRWTHAVGWNDAIAQVIYKIKQVEEQG